MDKYSDPLDLPGSGITVPCPTYKKILDFVQKKNTYNKFLTTGITPCIMALRQGNHKILHHYFEEKNYQDLIVSCYLYILRRYPSQNDVNLWVDHLEKGATKNTILAALKNSPEFQRSGIYYLKNLH